MWLLLSLALAADFDRHELGSFYLLPDVEPVALHRAARAVVDLGTGTAFVASADGYVLTNAHVADSLGSLVIARMSVSRELVILDLQEVRPDLDLAAYRIRQDTQPWIELLLERPGERDPLAVIGHPGGRPIQVSFGTVLTERALVGGTPSVEYSAQTWWGSSGSPVVDPTGRALAVHWGWDSDGLYHGRLLGVPVDLAASRWSLLQSLAECPDPSAVAVRREVLYDDEDGAIVRMSLEGPGPCLDRIGAVTWELHPTFREPEVEVSDRATGFAIVLSVWGMFDLEARYAMDGRVGRAPGRVHW